MNAIPASTYRLQFSPSFRFDDARALIPYLDQLGVGALYASPYLRARPGSTHGYDVVDHNALNPEIGTDAEHRALCEALRARGLGHVLDFVPNHMGVGDANPWWRDVLTWGERSAFAHYFDIDWRPLDPAMHGRVLLPFLGDHYGRVIDRSEIRLDLDRSLGRVVVRYYENVFPLSPESAAGVIDDAAGLADDPGVARSLRDTAHAFAGARPKPPESLRGANARLAALGDDPRAVAALEAAFAAYADADRLDALLDRQHWRLAYWRVAVDEINYRRFFDINDLAGLRVEEADVLGATHALIFRWIAEGRLQGLRIDHIDGLADPSGYANLLQDRAAALGQPLWVVVEKILASGERLRRDWRVAGTTGYEFMNLTAGLAVDPRARTAFDRIYARATGAYGDYPEIVYWTKRATARTSLGSELAVLANELRRIARTDRRSIDYTLNGLRDALLEVVAAFPVYRTYVRSEDVDPQDRTYIELAVERARRRDELADDDVYDFLRDCLLLVAPNLPDTRYDRAAVLDFALGFQQYTGPVTAKAVEDTAFYRYARLLALNEVGGDPARFGRSPAEFHRANAERAAARPHTMLSTATHDHKRGEDVRTRIAALTEYPADWARIALGWRRTLRHLRRDLDGRSAPGPVDEYVLYQTLAGTWPAEWGELAAVPADDLTAYAERIVAYMQKAAREAKVRTSWARPDAAYEAALASYVAGMLAPDSPALGALTNLVGRIAPVAAISSLAQTVLKLTAPGIPDVYAGTEWWDLSLVDPDNRRAVDYGAREAALNAMRERLDGGDLEALLAELLERWPDGRIKQYVTWRLLRLRRKAYATFVDGPYLPLAVRGRRAGHVVAYARGEIVTVVPRLPRRVHAGGVRVAYGEERVLLPAHAPARYVERFTRAVVEAEADGLRRSLAVGPLLRRFPVAVLVPQD